ncbi:hypothetical protein [Bacillus sp. FJAT-45350]|uniref:hypothetical protein n=1 Tax=Bacillus sp. FJAT-45350 TaxID=2011014 RepID=UPI000BB75BB5|nr:hypothetical protein [Bacillus sp. FJAT-45350]
MSEVELYTSSSTDLTITNQELNYFGKVIPFQNVQNVTCTQMKADYTIFSCLALIGLIITCLGKLRAGLVISDLIIFDHYLQLYNLWDSTGAFFLMISAYIFLLTKDRYLIDIKMKNGETMNIPLTKKVDQYSIENIEKSIKQAMRYTKFSVAAENPYESKSK